MSDTPLIQQKGELVVRQRLDRTIFLQGNQYLSLYAQALSIAAT
jgi:hypothetical protein